MHNRASSSSAFYLDIQVNAVKIGWTVEQGQEELKDRNLWNLIVGHILSFHDMGGVSIAQR